MATAKIRPTPPADLVKQIERYVMGEESSWQGDPTYVPTGDFEADYRAGDGDKQILLWAIYFAAKHGQPIPTWTAQELCRIMMAMATGEYRSWEEAFGPIYGKAIKGRVKQVGVRRKARMFEVVQHVDERAAGTSVDAAIETAVSKGIGGKTTVYGLRRLARRSAPKGP